MFKDLKLLKPQKEMLDTLDIQIKEKQRGQLEEIHEILRSSDLIVDNKKVSFEELLAESNIPTAIRMLIQNLKRQNVNVFQLESQQC
jgi:predicted transcriptional regulator